MTVLIMCSVNYDAFFIKGEFSDFFRHQGSILFNEKWSQKHCLCLHAWAVLKFVFVLLFIFTNDL